MENCYTGCQNKDHMTNCPVCGANYHIGLYHSCPTTYDLTKSLIEPNIKFSTLYDDCNEQCDRFRANLCETKDPLGKCDFGRCRFCLQLKHLRNDNMGGTCKECDDWNLEVFG